MESIPPIVRSVVEAHLKVLLYWFGDEIYRRLWRRAQDHFLVRLRDQLDFAPLEAACAAYHHHSGPGAPVVHPVSRLVRALLVKCLLDLSLRELEQAIQWNLLVKGFVGYALFECGPDHATLQRFEQWVWTHQSRTFFDEILRQIDRDFPEERRKAQVGDTYAMRANAATESLIELIRHTCRRLLKAVAETDTTRKTEVVSQLDQDRLFGSSDEVKEYRLEQTERSERLQTTVVAALACQAAVRAWLSSQCDLAQSDRLAVEIWLDILDKILADEVAISRSEQGQITSVMVLPKKKKGKYRIASATDPQATHRVHDTQRDFGYNVSMAATDSFIREIRVDTGSQPDPVAIVDLLIAQQEHHDLTPAKLIYDQAAGTGKWHAEVAKASDSQTQLVAPLIPYDQHSKRFGPDDFTLASDDRSLTCPNGQVSTTAYRAQTSEGRSFRFTAKQCTECPLTAQCRSDQVRPDCMRQVFITDHRSTLALARTYAQTAEFQADLKLRPTIERIIANLVRYHGARYARRRGQAKCDYQAKMSATAFNLRQWLRLQQRRQGMAQGLLAGT